MNPRMIIDLNINHYRELLKTEIDHTKRQTITKLLAEEEAKLTGLVSTKTRTADASE